LLVTGAPTNGVLCYDGRVNSALPAVVVVASLTGCGLYLDVGPVEQDSTAGPRTVARISVSADHIPSDLADFELLVRLPPGSALAARGEDDMGLAFYQGGEQLAHDIEALDVTSGALDAWVRIPLLSASEDTTLEVWMGKPPSGRPPEEVWEERWSAVWHMESAAPRDASGHGNSLVAPDGARTPTTAAGQIGQGASFDGSDDTLDAPSDPSLQASTALTLHGWVRPTTFAPAVAPIVCKARTFGSESHDYFLRIGDHETYFGMYGESLTSIYDDAGLALGEWHHLVAVLDDGTGMIWINGELRRSEPVTTPIRASERPIHVGSWGEYATFDGMETRTFDGVIDEVRISLQARSADYIRTTYANQSSPETFCTVELL
jgi:hypothetical protein